MTQHGETVRGFDVHGLVRLTVVGDGVDSSIVHHLLCEFETQEEIPEPDVVWYLDGRPAPSGAAPVAETDDLDRPDALMTVDEAGRWSCFGPGHSLYALLQAHLVRRRALLVHGCAIEVDGDGALFYGRGGVGKSTIAFAAAEQPGVRLLSDDKAIVLADGTLLGLPTPLSIYPYHRRALPEAGRSHVDALRVAVSASALLRRLPLGTAVGGAARRWLLARRSGSRLARLGREVNRDYLAVSARDVFSADRLATSTAGRVAAYLAPGAESAGGWRVADVGLDRSLSLLLAASYSELELQRTVPLYALAGAVDLAAHWRAAVEVATEFLSREQLLELTVPRHPQPAALQRFVLETVRGSGSTGAPR